MPKREVVISKRKAGEKPSFKRINSAAENKTVKTARIEKALDAFKTGITSTEKASGLLVFIFLGLVFGRIKR